MARVSHRFAVARKAARRRGRPLEDGQPPPRIRDLPASTRKRKGRNFPGPVRVQPVPMDRHNEDGLPMRVAGDEPQTQTEVVRL